MQPISCEKRNKIIGRYLPLIRKIAGRVIRTYPHCLDYDDLVNIGVFGLIQAIKNYDSKYHVNFSRYCKIRIRGSMLDELRRLDWIPRRTRQQIREVRKAEEEFFLRSKPAPNSKELTDDPCISPTLKKQHFTTSLPQIYSLNCIINDNSASSYVADPNSRKSCAAQEDPFSEFLKGLRKMEQLILTLYYQEGLNMYQIGLLLGLSESRISQIHSQIIQQLQKKYYKNTKQTTL